jgi:hypothetical protein
MRHIREEHGTIHSSSGLQKDLVEDNGDGTQEQNADISQGNGPLEP